MTPWHLAPKLTGVAWGVAKETTDMAACIPGQYQRTRKVISRRLDLQHNYSQQSLARRVSPSYLEPSNGQRRTPLDFVCASARLKIKRSSGTGALAHRHCGVRKLMHTRQSGPESGISARGDSEELGPSCRTSMDGRPPIPSREEETPKLVTAQYPSLEHSPPTSRYLESRRIRSTVMMRYRKATK